MSAILILVTGLVVVASIRFRHRAESGVPTQNSGNVKLELVWTMLPFSLLIGILVMTVIAMANSDPPTTDADGNDPPPDIVAIAHQFWWEIQYPRAGFTTANEYHLPAGQQLLMRLESADVIHDFRIPELSHKMDMIPGHSNEMWLRPIIREHFSARVRNFTGTSMPAMWLSEKSMEHLDFRKERYAAGLWCRGELALPLGKRQR